MHNENAETIGNICWSNFCIFNMYWSEFLRYDSYFHTRRIEIPLLLKPINYNGKFYVDGAISDNYIFRDCDIIVGNNIDFNRNFLFDQRFDLIDYTKNILIALISIITNIRYKSENCIVITSESFLPYFDNNSLFRMILDGYEKIEIYFKKKC